MKCNNCGGLLVEFTYYGGWDRMAKTRVITCKKCKASGKDEWPYHQ